MYFVNIHIVLLDHICNLIQSFHSLTHNQDYTFTDGVTGRQSRKNFSSSAWFLYRVRFWSCNTKFFQVLYSWVHKSVFFLETVGYFEYFKGIDFYILLFKTESYPTCLTRYVNYHQKPQIWEWAVQMWKGHHISDQGEAKTVVSLLDFLSLKWQQFKWRLTCKEALF